MSKEFRNVNANSLENLETPKGPDQPYMHGYNAEQLRNWHPDKDPYAKYFRSHVPLAERIDSFQPVQAHPNLTRKANVLSLSADYDKEEWFAAYRYNDSFNRNILKFWQYHDIYASWHGLPVYGSEEDDREDGVVNIPNPAYTDAAHRNGVLSLGCWFWPRSIEFDELLERDEEGTYIVAKKMVEMARYFGFDGYFVNQEATITEEQANHFMKMLKYMRKEGLYLSWYDCLARDGKLYYVNGFNEVNAPWVLEDEDQQRANDSLFMNYAYTSKRLDEAAHYAKELGLDPYETLYAGIENDKFRFERGKELAAIFKEDEARTPRTSLALFGTDMVWNRGPNQFDPNMQPYIEERECMYWSGPRKNPRKSGRKRNSEALSWPGIAHYIPARSVIGSYPFVTRFNNGHGLAFFKDGEKLSDRPWNHVGIQDILPTWQWWLEGEGLSVSYDYDKAWNGGSSIAVQGSLDKEATLHLYKTDLPVGEQTKFALTYLQATDDVQMEAMFLFKEDPHTPVYVDLKNKKQQHWSVSEKSLAEFSGQTIAAIGLKFSTETKQDLSIYLGELKLTDGETKIPEAPTGFTVEKAYTDGKEASLFLAWNFKRDPHIWHYDLYQVDEQHDTFLGRVYDGVYYVKSVDVKGKKDVTLALVAVGKDGIESKPTTLQWSVDVGEDAVYEKGPFPVQAMGFHADEKLQMEIGWERYLYVWAKPSYATNIHLTWTSSDPTVAIVDERGKVTAKGVGQATITAQAGTINGEEGKKIEAQVSVVKPVLPKDGVVIPAEKYTDSNGIFNPPTYLHVRDLNFANRVSYEEIDFGEEGVTHLYVHAAVKEAETVMEIRLGDEEDVWLEMALEKKSGLPAPNYHLYEAPLPNPLTGKQTIHITFKNPRSRFWQVRDVGIVDVDWFQFK